MEIYKDIEIRDLSLKYKGHLFVSDLHIGLEESINKQGILIPRFQFSELKERIRKLLTKEIKVIVITGDLKHEFGTISEQEWRHTIQIIDLMLENSRKVVLVKGNHDTILEPIAKKTNVEIVDKYEIDNITAVHGDKLIKISTKILIIGHQHPAIGIDDDIRRETFKCFLKGKYKNSTLLVLPSFNLVNLGSDVLLGEIFSPFIKNLGDFEVYISEDKIYNFGKIKDFK